jgi:HSP20 family protein
LLSLPRRSVFPSLVVSGKDDFANMIRRMLNEPLMSADTTFPWSPAVEIAELSDALVVTAELPGLEERDLNINIENNVLTLSGQKEQERQDESPAKAYHVTERFYGAFQRSFALPRSIDTEKVKAVFEKGVLTITLPKIASAKGRTVPVTAK